MVRLALRICAQLENVESLSLDDSVDTRLHMKIKCTNCGEEGGKIYMDGSMHPTGSGQEANYVGKCKLCKRQITMTINNKTYKPYSNDPDSDNPSFGTVVEIEARGGEPTDFEFHGAAWKAKVADSRTIFQDLEFSEPGKEGIDWCEFDAATNQTVGIYNLQATFDDAEKLPKKF